MKDTAMGECDTHEFYNPGVDEPTMSCRKCGMIVMVDFASVLKNKEGVHAYRITVPVEGSYYFTDFDIIRSHGK